MTGARMKSSTGRSFETGLMDHNTGPSASSPSSLSRRAMTLASLKEAEHQ
jgi:hypothetical protein